MSVVDGVIVCAGACAFLFVPHHAADGWQTPAGSLLRLWAEALGSGTSDLLGGVLLALAGTVGLCAPLFAGAVGLAHAAGAAPNTFVLLALLCLLSAPLFLFAATVEHTGFGFGGGFATAVGSAGYLLLPVGALAAGVWAVVLGWESPWARVLVDVVTELLALIF